MTQNSASPTPTGLLTKATSLLIDAGYERVTGVADAWDSSTSRLFEDDYNVVGIAVVDTCADLLQSWPDLQSSLAEVITEHIAATEGKAWDGYLVLLTTGVAPSERAALDAVRYDTSRLRKLVATGEDLTIDADVERVLRPLIPMKLDSGQLEVDSTFALLPELLAEQAIPTEETNALIKAFSEQASLMDRLHEVRTR